MKSNVSFPSLAAPSLRPRAIGELVMDSLSNLDRVAWVRFASVYRDFRDIESFKEAIDALLQPESLENGVHPDQISLLEHDEIPPARSRRRSKRSKTHLIRPLLAAKLGEFWEHSPDLS